MAKKSRNRRIVIMPEYTICNDCGYPDNLCECYLKKECMLCGAYDFSIGTIENNLGFVDICYNCWKQGASFMNRDGCGVRWGESLEMERHFEKISSNKKTRPKISNNKRKRIHERDAYRCIYCGDYKNLVIDHIVPVCQDGTNDDNNLVTACRRCNTSKGKKKASEWEK